MVERRDGTALLLAPDRVRLTYDEMLAGTEIELRADGFAFTPYRMLVANPMMPVPIQVRAQDACTWNPDTGVLHDTIDLRLGPVALGRVTSRLRATQG